MIAPAQHAVQSAIDDPIQAVVELPAQPGLAVLNRGDQRFVVGPTGGGRPSAPWDGSEPISDARCHREISTLLDP